MKYKVGDKVLLKNFTEEQIHKWTPAAARDYLNMKSRIVIIDRIGTWMLLLYGRN